MAPDNPTHTLHRIIRRLLSLHTEDGHPPLDIHRIDRRVHPLHVGSSGERRLHSFLPYCHLSCSNLHVLTPRHVFTLLPRTAKRHEPGASIATPRLASLTRQGTLVNLACPPSTSSRVALLRISPHKTWDLC